MSTGPNSLLGSTSQTMESNADSGQGSGKRRCEVEVPVGWDLRFHGKGLDQPLRRVGDLPQGGPNEYAARRMSSAPGRPSAGNACSIASASEIGGVQGAHEV